MKKLIVALMMFLAVSTANAGDWEPSDNGSYIYAHPLGGDYTQGVAVMYADNGTPIVRYMLDLGEPVGDDYVWRAEKFRMWVDFNGGYTTTDVKFTKQAATVGRLVSTEFTVPDEFIDELKAGAVLRFEITTYDGKKYAATAFGLAGFTRMNSKLLNGDFE